MNALKLVLLTVLTCVPVSGMWSDMWADQYEPTFVKMRTVNTVQYQLSCNFRQAQTVDSAQPLFGVLAITGPEIFKYLSSQEIGKWIISISAGVIGQDHKAFIRKMIADIFPLRSRGITKEQTQSALSSYFYDTSDTQWIERIFSQNLDLSHRSRYLKLFFELNRQPDQSQALVVRIFKKDAHLRLLEVLLNPLELDSLKDEDAQRLLLKNMLCPDLLQEIFPQEFRVMGNPMRFEDCEGFKYSMCAEQSSKFDKIIQFTFEKDQEKNIQYKFLSTLLKTSLASRALALFFTSLKTDEAKQQFVENSLFDPYVLLSFNANKEILSNFPALRDEVSKRNGWLSDAMNVRLNDRSYFFTPYYYDDLPYTERAQKIFGYVVLMQNTDVYEKRLKELCQWDQMQDTQLLLLNMQQQAHKLYHGLKLANIEKAIGIGKL